MKKYLVTMGGREKGGNRHNASYGIHRDYESEAVRLFSTAKPYDFECIKYDNNFMDSFSQHDPIQEVLKGDSWNWCFKPLCIWEVFKKASNDDVIFWVDSNHAFIKDPLPITDVALRNNIFCHDHPGIVYPNKDWTTKDMFVKMDCDSSLFWDAPQMQVNIIAFKKNHFTRNFIEEWVKHATDYDTMVENKLANLSGFREPRFEQSIFSILVKKYDIAYHPYPASIIDEMNGINVQ